MKENNASVRFIRVSENEVGQRIDNFLRTYLKRVPKSMIYRILRTGKVRINKKRIKPKYKLQCGDELRVPPVLAAGKKKTLVFHGVEKVIFPLEKILYEDDYLLILNKPSGTAVHGGSGFKCGLIEWLRILRPDSRFLELVHRLDRDTSGVLLLAKKRSALHALHEQLREKRMKKDYLALVRGQWKSNIKEVVAPLLKHILANGKRIVQVNSQGKFSETHFKVKERFTMATLVKASLITGRTHQIRVHSLYADHPIAFDDRYGDSIFDKTLEGCGLNRLFLHAVSVCFEHPNSGEILFIEAPLDLSLHNCLVYLRAHHKLSSC